MKFTEAQLQTFAAPLSESESQKCQNAINMVRDALIPLGFSSEGRTVSPMYADTYSYSIRMVNKSKGRDVKMFVQGSYANNTNVRTQSDVDIAIVQEDVFNSEVRLGVSKSQYGIIDVPEPPQSFKDEVQAYLVATFRSDVIRKNKSIKINGNTYRKDTDTVPSRRFRDYRSNYSLDINNYVGGIRIVADDGTVIINYPEQHIANGRAKNNSTNYYYKKMVRIAKVIRNIMVDSRIISANSVCSFGIESLLWNIPDAIYLKFSTYKYIFDAILYYLVNNINSVNTYYEANGIKLLCPTVSDVLAYQAFIRDIRKFYEYEI
jgi:hypothetical protein